MRKPHEKSSDESSAITQRNRVQQKGTSPADPLLDFQESAGNQAMLQLLGSGVVQRKGKGSESGAAESGATPSPEAAPGKALIVEDEAKEVGPAQMRKGEFLSQLRSAVCSTAEEALGGTMWSAMGCPYIDKWLNHYAGQPSSYLERALRKYAPETAAATTAHDYIPIVTRRVRQGIEEWRSTGEVEDLPEEFAEGGMPGATVSGLMGGLLSGVGSAISGLVSGAGKALSSLGSMLFKHREGSEAATDADPQAIREELGSGQSLDSSVRRRMQSAFGHDFAGVRVHTGAKAQELSEGLNARAFTIGNDIAFSGEEYKPGTPVGDALIAHELAHVVQQGGSASGGAQHKGEAAYGSLEEDADRSAVGAVAKLWLGARGELSEIGQNAMPRMRSGLRLQGCSSPEKKKTEAPMKDGATKDAAQKPVVLSGDWAKDVEAAKKNSDEAMMVALVKKAVGTYTVHAAGKSSTGKEDPKDYQKTPVVNFDINLKDKEKYNGTRKVGDQPGHFFAVGSDAYAVLGPAALKPASPLITRMYAEHELYHTTHHVKKEITYEDQELEAWTVDFTNYFHQFLAIESNRPTFGPLLDYYADASADAKKATLEKLQKYYEKPVTDAKEAEKVKDAMSLWVLKWKDRKGEKNRKGDPLSKELINEMDKFVKPYSR